MTATFDAVVIGGGIMGCATALELSRRGVKVAVVEKGVLAGGSTGRSSAIVRQHYSNETTARMARWGLDVFRDFGQRVGGECGFVNAGFLVLVPAADEEGLRANVELQRGVGVNTRVIAPEDVRELLPGMDDTDLVAAAWEPDSGYADPHGTTTSLADAAKRHGASFFLGTEVTGIRFSGTPSSGKELAAAAASGAASPGVQAPGGRDGAPRSGGGSTAAAAARAASSDGGAATTPGIPPDATVLGVDTPAGPIDAPAVVNCAGPWGARVAALAGLEVPVSSCRAQVAVFGRPPEHRGPHPVVLDFVHASYFRPETGDLMLVGLIDPAEAEDVVDPDAMPDHTVAGFDALVGERWVRRCPPMETAELRRGYAGLYGITPDWHPVIDEVPAGSGHFLCTGFSGHGFKLGPAVGLLTAQLVTGEEPEFDPRMFRLARYAEGDPVRGRYEYSITG